MRDRLRIATVCGMLLFALCLSLHANAQELTESEAIARALTESARLRALRARPAQIAAEQNIRRLQPNPVVSFLQESAAGTRDRFVLVQQELPTSGRLRLLRQAGTAAVLAADLRVKHAEYEIRQDTRAAFTRLVAGQARIQQLTSTVQTLEGLTSRLTERERAGDGSRFDRLRAERELADLKAERRAAEAHLAEARAALAGLLGITGESPLVASGPMGAVSSAPTLDIVLATARTRRIELQTVNAEISRLEFDQRAASRLGRPQPVASVGLKQTDDGIRSDTGYAVSLGVALPLFNRGQADVAVAGAALTAARAERDALMVEIEQEVRGAHAGAALLAALTDEYQRDALDRSRELVRIATVAYDDGELGILELLDAHRSLVNAELRAMNFRAEARLATIRLDRAIGEEVGR
ncbi:MAG TPA: TolC family protein [Vicinamibacterales bacterium]|nr:TolC family protein [Vicinamibacterales bacterium]